MANIISHSAPLASTAPYDLKKDQLASAWVQEKNGSLLSKLYRFQIRLTVLPKEIIIQEVATSILKIAMQQIMAKLSQLWGGEPKFTVSLVGEGKFPVSNLTTEQIKEVEEIFNTENPAIDRDGSDIAFFTFLGSISKKACKIVDSSSLQGGVPKILKI